MTILRAPLLIASFALALALPVASAVPAAAQAAPRITGGTKVTAAQYHARWGSIVSIQTVLDPAFERAFGSGNARGRHTCGGTLIAPRIVVTAAHCVENTDALGFANATTRVLAGTRVLAKSAKQPGRMVDVAEIRVHPQWRGVAGGLLGDVDGGDMGHDVAVVKLAEPLDGVPVTPLVEPGDRAAWGGGAGLARGAVVAGWGSTNPLLRYSRGNDSFLEMSFAEAQLRQTPLPLLPDATCERTDSPMGGSAVAFDRATMLCGYRRDTTPAIGTSNRRGPCHGDSGGPLLVRTATGQWRLAGIVSWGSTAAGGCNRASVFTRVDAVRDWISSVVADAPLASTLPAPTGVTATPTSVNSLRVTWKSGASAARRYTLLREVRFADFFGGFSYLLSSIEDDEGDEDGEADKVRAFLNAQVLLPLGAGGPEARSMVIRDLLPRRAGTKSAVALRVVVRDEAGGVARSARLAIARPVDSRPPSKVRAPRVAQRGERAPEVAWAVAHDDDCVQSYELQVRRHGARRWRTNAIRIGRCGAGLGRAGEGAGQPTWGDSEEVPVIRVGFRAAIRGVKPGTYAVRVVAKDRVGNRSIGGVSTVHVRKAVRGSFDDDCFEVDEGAYLCQSGDSVNVVSVGLRLLAKAVR